MNLAATTQRTFVLTMNLAAITQRTFALTRNLATITQRAFVLTMNLAAITQRAFVAHITPLRLCFVIRYKHRSAFPVYKGLICNACILKPIQNSRNLMDMFGIKKTVFTNTFLAVEKLCRIRPAA